jgi:hypothetical protein
VLASEIVERDVNSWHFPDDDVLRHPFPKPSDLDSAHGKRAETLLHAAYAEQERVRT